MKNHCITRLAGLLCCLALLAGTATAQDERAQAVLKQARAALGGEEQLKNLQSLVMQGTSRHTLPGPQAHTIEEKFELSFLLPDKFMKVKTLPAPPNSSGETTIHEGLNGEQEWMDVDSKGGDVMFFRANEQAGMAGVAGVASGGGHGVGAVGAVGAVGRLHVRTGSSSGQRAEFARLLLAFALTAPSTLPVEWSYAGKAEAADGRADALEIKGADGFTVRLLFDEKTHLPSLLTYQTKAMERGVAMTFEAAIMPGGGQPFGGQIRRAMPLANVELPPPSGKDVEMQMRFSNYVNLAGWQFPQQVSFLLDGQVVEEWDSLNWQINPGLSPDQFQPRKK